jgi:hypothetical protein
VRWRSCLYHVLISYVCKVHFLVVRRFHCAVNKDESYEIRDGVVALGEALAKKGYAPR